MVTRTWKEVRISYTPPSTNPGYGWLKKLAEAIVEVCGAEQQSSATGNITLTLPDFPGVLYMSASSSGSSVTLALRKSGSSTNLLTSKSVTCANNMSVCFGSIGGFLNLLRFSREGSTEFPLLSWSWFKGAYTEEIYYYLTSSGGANFFYSSLNFPYTSSNTTYAVLFSEDLSKSYTGGFVNSSSVGYEASQPYTAYPRNSESKILRPYAASCGITTEGVPNPGYCKWGGEYMLFALCGNNSYAPITTEPQLTYKLNGKNYLVCGSTLIIPEPWPFKEDE